MKQFLKSFISWFVVYRWEWVDRVGGKSRKRGINWGETIFVYVAILLIILVLALCVNPQQSAIWYGQPGTGG
jgi:hypothetical protein